MPGEGQADSTEASFCHFCLADIRQISIQLYQLLANTAAATEKCAGQMHFAASYAPFFLLLQNTPALWTILDTRVRLKLPSNDSVWESGSSWGTHCSLSDFCAPAAVLE